MTCQEVMATVGRKPEECTRAERAAVRNHCDECRDCFVKITRSCDRQLAKMSAGEATESVIRGILLRLSDSDDPEV